MLVDFAMSGLGLVILLLAGDFLVKGAVNLSLRLGIPALLISLTIVAFGTSAPELLIAIQSVWDGHPGLALGNVIGSNTANILLVLGVPALIISLSGQSDTRQSFGFMILGSALFVALLFIGPLVWWHGLVLLAALSIFMGMSVYDHRQKAGCVEPDEDELEGADPNIKTWQIVVFLCMGIIGLPVGAHILVEYSVSIATGFGISDTVIGLTLVAIGTSLPELATSVMAAVRRQADVAIGNVIGSNIFNLLGIIGVTAVIGRIPVDPALLRFDIWVMLGASLFLVPVVFFVWRIGRGVGALFCALYAAYLFVLF